MSENCSHNCSSCGETCASRTMESFRVPLNPQSSVKKVIGVVSGKGGVGKSLVTSLMACKMRARNNRVGILDADITGPSIPKAFGIHGMVGVTADQLMLPRTTSTGIEILSSNLILEHETDPVIWRGPVVGGVIKQFWSEALWKDIDYMFVDMPPGTGDIHLSLMQDLKISGAIIVSTPQKIALADVRRGIGMFRAKQINIPVLGIVENMAWFTPAELPANRYYIFGKGGAQELARSENIPLLAEIPLIQSVREAADAGTPVATQESTSAAFYTGLAKNLVTELEKTGH